MGIAVSGGTGRPGSLSLGFVMRRVLRRAYNPGEAPSSISSSGFLG